MFEWIIIHNHGKLWFKSTVPHSRMAHSKRRRRVISRLFNDPGFTKASSSYHTVLLYNSFLFAKFCFLRPNLWARPFAFKDWPIFSGWFGWLHTNRQRNLSLNFIRSTFNIEDRSAPGHVRNRHKPTTFAADHLDAHEVKLDLDRKVCGLLESEFR